RGRKRRFHVGGRARQLVPEAPPTTLATKPDTVPSDCLVAKIATVSSEGICAKPARPALMVERTALTTNFGEGTRGSVGVSPEHAPPRADRKRTLILRSDSRRHWRG